MTQLTLLRPSLDLLHRSSESPLDKKEGAHILMVLHCAIELRASLMFVFNLSIKLACSSDSAIVLLAASRFFSRHLSRTAFVSQISPSRRFTEERCSSVATHSLTTSSCFLSIAALSFSTLHCISSIAVLSSATSTSSFSTTALSLSTLSCNFSIAAFSFATLSSSASSAALSSSNWRCSFSRAAFS